MADIGQSEDGVTFINVLEIPRADLEAFKASWRKLGGIMASAAGFRGAQLHEAVSDDTRFQLVNVARWESEQAWRDAGANPEMQSAYREVGAGPVQRAVHNTGLYRPVLTFDGRD